MKTLCNLLVLLSLLPLLSVPAMGQKRKPGILQQQAPSFGVSTWFNLPKGRATLDIHDFKDKVLYLYCFQSWCPGCHAEGFPTLQRLIKKYAKAKDVAFVAVQTVFEGYEANTAARARETAERYGLSIPVGHDGIEGKKSVLMGRYRTGGTPWTVIIDKQGKVRFNDFHTTAEEAGRLIDKLRKEKGAPPVKTLPKARGGQDLIGKRLPGLSFDRWLNRPKEGKKPAKRLATLYRWWTDSCLYCKASLPAMEKLRTRYKDRGLEVVAVYHPKPPRERADGAILKAVKGFGFSGPVAVDLNWSELKKAYLDSGRRSATSVSILVDGDGVVRFVHPGPILFPSEKSEHARENRDFQLLEQAIMVLVKPD